MTVGKAKNTHTHENKRFSNPYETYFLVELDVGEDSVHSPGFAEHRTEGQREP